MQQRKFGNTGVSVGEVGTGCWQFGGDWGTVTEDDALATLRAAAEAGANFIDTADVYGSGRSEEIIGRWRSEDRPQDVFIATKLGRRGDPGWPENFTYETMRAHTEDSLRRLGMDALDLTQLHCIPTDVLAKGEVFDHLRRLQTEGKIRHFGVSVESMEEAHICLAQPGLTSLQIIFNLFRQKPIDDLFPAAIEKSAALIIRLPLASGLLAGKYTAETTFSAQDHRTYNRNGEAFSAGETFAGLPFETGVALADALKPLVPAGQTLAEMALRWCLQFDAVSVLIPGAKDADQARANIHVADLPPLGDDLMRQLRQFYDERHISELIRGAY